MKKAFKYRIYPTAEQQAFLGRTFGCCRFVWNQLLAKSQADYHMFKDGLGERPDVSGFGFIRALGLVKINHSFLNEVSSTALQQKLGDLGIAYQKFFKGSGFPKYKKKYSHQSFRLTSRNFAVDGNRLLINKGTAIKIRIPTSGLPYNPSSVTISRDPSGRYFASFLCEVEITRKCGDGITGIDLGLKDLMVLSTGEKVANPKYLHRSLKSLARLQRRLSRKVKGSKNRNKQRIKVARLYARIADTRKDHLHKLTSKLINENQVICLETLKVSNMVRNRSLSRAISDVSWGTLVQFLGYKAAESGASIILIDQYYPSTQTCSACGHRLTGSDKLTLNVRRWTCPHCGTKHDRDTNAAVNILHEGIRVMDSASPGAVTLV